MSSDVSILEKKDFFFEKRNQLHHSYTNNIDPLIIFIIYNSITKFDLELNPFERSFATKESSSVSLNELAASNNDAISDVNSVATSGSSIKNGSSSNKHNLHIHLQCQPTTRCKW